MKYQPHKLEDNSSIFHYRIISPEMESLEWIMGQGPEDPIVSSAAIKRVDLALLPGTNVRMAVVSAPISLLSISHEKAFSTGGQIVPCCSLISDTKMSTPLPPMDSAMRAMY